MASRNAYDGVAGVIMKLELTNFMCHASLALDFNPSVNFIVGKNGSGKSAIMTALMVVLGTKATDTSRGKTLMSFIKSGCHQARVKITLKNKGMNCYKPEQYGPTIILVRTITKAGGKFTIHSLRGGMIHLPRLELDAILQTFNIKLPNPFALLTQETMKTFLNQSKPTHMYDLVREGTGVKDAQHKVSELGKKLSWMTKKHANLVASVNEKKAELKLWTEKRKVLDKVMSTKEKIEALNIELTWSKVIAEEYQLTQYQKCLQKFLDNRREKERGLEAFQKRIDKVQEKICENEIDLLSWKMQTQNKAAEREALKKEFEQCKTNAATLGKDLQALQQKIREIQGDIKVLENGIKKYAKETSPEEVARRAERRKQVEQMEAELVDMKATKATLVREENRLRDENRANQGAIQEKRADINELKSQTNRQKQNLEQAKKQAGAVPTCYGPRMAALLKEIDKAFAQGKFSKKPIGPLGMHVKVKDEAWTLAIEGFLRSEMQAFYCNTNEDRLLLTKLCNSVMPQYKLIAVISKFVEKVFDVSHHKAVASGNLVNLMDMLEIKNPVVMNYFIDNKSVETVLLCDTSEEAMSIMCQQNRVPSRCKLMLTKDAEQVYPAPNYRFYSSEITSVRFLVKSKAASIRNEEAQIAKGEARVTQLEKELKEMIEASKSTEQEFKETSNQLKNLHSRETNMKRSVEDNKEKESDNRDVVTTLREELEEKNAEIERLETDRQRLKEEADAAKEKRVNTETALKDLVIDFNIVKEKQDEFLEKKHKLEDQLTTEQERARREREKHDKDLDYETTLTENVEKQAKVVENAEKLASEKGPRVNTRRLADAIEREIEENKVYMTTLNSKLDDPLVIHDKITKLGNDISKIIPVIEKLGEECKANKKQFTERKNHYLNAFMFIYVHIGEVFKILIDKQHFEGRIDFDHGEKKMNIILTTKGKNKEEVKNLSGGERSYTTISLILAVWDNLRIPFFMLDEFDVFMDMMNRRMCSDMLVTAALEKKGRQFMFFTPQEMTLDASKDVTIHKLSDPRAD